MAHGSCGRSSSEAFDHWIHSDEVVTLEEEGRKSGMIITIDVEYSINGFEKHFCTIVDDAKDVHQALMDCIKFVDNHSARYVDHTIIVRKKVEEGAEE